jgi:hypothetical protein
MVRKLLEANHSKNALSDMPIEDLFAALTVKALDAIGSYKRNGSVVTILL